MQQWEDLTTLRYLGQGLADQKEERIRMNNRLDRGGINLNPALSAEIRNVANHAEEAYNKMLIEEYKRQVPEEVRAWAADIPGLASGELFPRIIAAIGNPRIATPQLPDPDDPEHKLLRGEPFERTVGQLRQYCGVGNPRLKPRKGMTQADLFALGKIREVRPLLFTWSSILVKMATPAKEGSKNPGQPRSVAAAESEWWKLFTRTKRWYAGHDGKCGEGWPSPCAVRHQTHKWDCQNHKPPRVRPNGCGIAAHREWGEIGSPWRPGHIDMAAHRKLHQYFLEKLWEISGEKGWDPAMRSYDPPRALKEIVGS